MVFLTRIEHFNAAHRLFNTNWSNEDNFRVFGKCSNENWHGHNYELYVTVKGKPDPETGFAINAKTLSDIIKDKIIEKLDHKNLNIEVDFLKGKITTSENLVIGIWDELKPYIESNYAKLHYIKLVESPNIYVEYFG